MSLEFQGALWLKLEKKCPLVLFEKTPRYGHGQPDVLGVNERRFIFEIEVKRTISDFRANAKKPHIINRETLPEFAERFPRQFWYLLPLKLAEKIHEEVPKWAGLLALTEEMQDAGYYTPLRIKSLKPAPTNQVSRKLSLAECARLLKNVGNEIFSLRCSQLYARNQTAFSGDPHVMDNFYSSKWDGYKQVHNPDYLNFQI